MQFQSSNEMSAKFESFVELIPGATITETTLQEIVDRTFNLLLHLNAVSKVSFLQDCVVLLEFVSNMENEKKAKKKQPDADLLTWLNVIGPLVELLVTKTCSAPLVPDSDSLSISFDDGEGGEASVFLLPRRDVCFIIPNNSCHMQLLTS